MPVSQGPDVEALGPVVRPATEGDEKGIAQQVVGQFADPAAQVAVHLAGMPVEQRGEELRLLDRPSDQGRVRGLGRRQRP